MKINNVIFLSFFLSFFLSLKNNSIPDLKYCKWSQQRDETSLSYAKKYSSLGYFSKSSHDFFYHPISAKKKQFMKYYETLEKFTYLKLKEENAIFDMKQHLENKASEFLKNFDDKFSDLIMQTYKIYSQTESREFQKFDYFVYLSLAQTSYENGQLYFAMYFLYQCLLDDKLESFKEQIQYLIEMLFCANDSISYTISQEPNEEIMERIKKIDFYMMQDDKDNLFNCLKDEFKLKDEALKWRNLLLNLVHNLFMNMNEDRKVLYSSEIKMTKDELDAFKRTVEPK